ncbi:MAG: hypothetical protein HOQ01_08110 [Lysobacter sp.]|jgi:hypothetical protein|nr:hypothetical protein [Lysobacter sp.]
MRIAPIALALSAVLLAASAAHAQDARKTFTGQGVSEKVACDAANRAARDWVKQGKSAGRARELLEEPQCACTASGNAQTCKLDVAVRDEQHEEEEER